MSNHCDRVFFVKDTLNRLQADGSAVLVYARCALRQNHEETLHRSADGRREIRPVVPVEVQKR